MLVSPPVAAAHCAMRVLQLVGVPSGPMPQQLANACCTPTGIKLSSCWQLGGRSSSVTTHAACYPCHSLHLSTPHNRLATSSSSHPNTLNTACQLSCCHQPPTPPRQTCPQPGTRRQTPPAPAQREGESQLKVMTNSAEGHDKLS
jgi:hypothetical protein